MKSQKAIFVILAVLMTLLSGCIRTRGDIKAEEERTQQNEMQEIKAGMKIEINDLQEQVRALNGRVSDVEQLANAEPTEEEKRQKAEQQSFSRKLTLLEEALVGIEASVKQVASNQNSIDLKLIDQSKKIAALESQLAELRKIKQTGAEAKKTSKVPKGNYASGEYYFAKKDWKNAITGYQNYREMNPKGKRYSESTYKIGVSFEEIGMPTDAKVFYDEVIAKFPNSKDAKKAQIRLRKLAK